MIAALAAVFARTPANTDVPALHNRILAALMRADSIAEEARRERTSYLSTEPDAAPLPRTLHRIRADMIMIGRAAPGEFPDEIRARLAPLHGRCRRR